jgi:hypothetical protein
LSSVFLVGLGLKEMKLASAFGKMIFGYIGQLGEGHKEKPGHQGNKTKSEKRHRDDLEIVQLL